MSLLSKSIPPVSLEFAKELKARFIPLDVKPGFDRDKLMESVGEQNVIRFIMFHAQNSVSKSTIDILDKEVEKKEEVIIEERKPTLFEMFTSRFGN